MFARKLSLLLIVLGARFDDRATGKLAEFAPHARVVHFDIDAAEIGKLRTAHVAVAGELKPAIEALTARLATSPLAIDPWIIRCASARRVAGSDSLPSSASFSRRRSGIEAQRK